MESMGLAVPPAMRLCRLTSRTDEPNVCRVHITDVPDVPEVIGRGRGNVIYISGCLTRHWFGAQCKEEDHDVRQVQEYLRTLTFELSTLLLVGISVAFRWVGYS